MRRGGEVRGLVDGHISVGCSLGLSCSIKFKKNKTKNYTVIFLTQNFYNQTTEFFITDRH